MEWSFSALYCSCSLGAFSCHLQEANLYHVPLRMPITHDLLPKWTENEEVLCYLRGQVEHIPPYQTQEALMNQ